VSRKRCFTGALRRAIEVRDRRCQHPSGCDEPASRCDVDHIVPYSDGGVSSQDNGEIRCHPHNRDQTKRNLRPKPKPDDGRAGDDNPGTGQPDQRPPPDAA
jgi:5-methylcytosine-specific restriction endonuclease McrA